MIMYAFSGTSPSLQIIYLGKKDCLLNSVANLSFYDANKLWKPGIAASSVPIFFIISMVSAVFYM